MYYLIITMGPRLLITRLLLSTGPLQTHYNAALQSIVALHDPDLLDPDEDRDGRVPLLCAAKLGGNSSVP